MNGLNRERLRNASLSSLLADHPLLESVLLEEGLEVDGTEARSLPAAVLGQAHPAADAVDPLLERVLERFDELASLLAPRGKLTSLEIIGGHDKSGGEEPVARLRLQPGDLLTIVGPTGSGKSRLLADIEWFAEADTPSGRRILVDGNSAAERRFSRGADQLVAQLSQTMSFVLDATVEELLALHVESRGLGLEVVEATLDAANDLAGEPFRGTTPLTSLSGGQTRALMVADTAMVCRSPIVLIDEIENAGIDRRRAFDLLLAKDKIVLSATHDPLLALLAPRRLSMKQGGMYALLDRTADEEALLLRLEALDDIHAEVRRKLRAGERIDTVDFLGL